MYDSSTWGVSKLSHLIPDKQYDRVIAFGITHGVVLGEADGVHDETVLVTLHLSHVRGLLR